jgi:RNA polymerase sigma-70 factor (ECF subfamily)
VSFVDVNGQPGLLAVRDGTPLVLVTMDAGADGVHRLLMILNPAKLSGLAGG